jgi:hypothetical protein
MLQSRTRVLLTAGYRSNFYCGTIVSVAVDHLEFWSMHAIVFVLQGDFCIELFLPVQSGCLLRASSAKPYAQTFWGLCEGLGRGSLGGGKKRTNPTQPFSPKSWEYAVVVVMNKESPAGFSSCCAFFNFGGQSHGKPTGSSRPRSYANGNKDVR